MAAPSSQGGASGPAKVGRPNRVSTSARVHPVGGLGTWESSRASVSAIIVDLVGRRAGFG